MASAEDAAGSVACTAGTPVATLNFKDGKALIGDYVELSCDGTYWYAAGLVNVQDAVTFV